MKKNKILSSIFVYVMIFALMAFTVHALPATAVDLGEAGHFAVLSKAAISDIPLSVITGEVGVSPAAGSFITGLTCPEVTGATAFPIHVPSGASRPCDVVDPVYLTTVVSNMETAYTAAQAEANGVGPFLNLGGGTIIAQTLTPGVYTWGSDVLITDDLTLDCQGNSSAVFVFQIISGGKLELSAGKKIILAGNCQSGNIFWAVQGLTNLLIGSHLEGTVLGSPGTSEITLITGATVNGRLLGEKTIALDTNTITLPKDTIPPVTTDVSSLNNTVQSYTTTSVLLNVTTDKNATCRFDTTNIAYDNMTFNFTDNGTQHSATYTVSSGTSYTLYVLCRDVLNNTDNTSTIISFSVDSVPVAPKPAPVNSGGGSGGGGSSWTCTDLSVCGSDGTQTKVCTATNGATTTVTRTCTPTQTTPVVKTPVPTTPITPPVTSSGNNGQNVVTPSTDNSGATQTGGNAITGQVVGNGSGTSWWSNFWAWVSRLFGGK